MPVEEIASGIFSFIARGIGWFVVEILLHIVCGSIGWVLMKAFTLGKYPNQHTKEETIILVGIIAMTTGLVVLTFYASK